MSTHSIRLALAAALCAIATHDAMAASQRTFVASYGMDTNACTLLAPCRSFATALAQTVPGGETVVLDSAGYGPFTVSQAATILAPAGVYAGISVFSGAGITVNAGATDKVTLRGLTVNSISGAQGIVYASGAALYLDNVIVTGFTSGAGAGGLVAAAAASGSIYVIDSAFRDNSVGATFTASAGTLTVSLERVLFERNPIGVTFADRTAATMRGSIVSGATTGIVVAAAAGGNKVEVRDTTISGSTGAALAVGPAASASVASFVNSLATSNGVGVQAQGAANIAYVSSSTITRNATGVSATGGGAVVSGLDNWLVGNTSDGIFSSSVARQ